MSALDDENIYVFKNSSFTCADRCDPNYRPSSCNSSFRQLVPALVLTDVPESILPSLNSFYPTALKGCRGVVFIRGVQMGGWWENVCPGCISETILCRKLILGRNEHWLGGVGVQRHGVTLI